MRRGERLGAATLKRLCVLYGRLENLSSDGRMRVTSFELAEDLGTSAASVRRDISTVGELGPSPVGYDVEQLKRLLEGTLGLDRAVRVCVIGLNWLGSALVSGGGAGLGGFRIVAGFDANTNRLETTHSAVPLFPSYEMEEVVRREAVEIALITLLAQPAAEILGRLSRGGVRGVLNMSGRSLGPSASGLVCGSVAVLDELRSLSVMLRSEEGQTK
jgi:redox-sensing transcriptional repressor